MSYFNLNSFADLGAATVQAVCRVTLKSGEKIEGFIKVFQGGYIRRYKPNGFCVVRNDSVVSSLFFDLRNSRISLNASNDSDKIYYADCPNNNDWTYNTQNKIKVNKNTLILERQLSDTDEYILHDYVLIYSKLPLHLYLSDYYEDNSQREEFYTIQTKDIVSIEILKEPSQHWLVLILQAREKINNHIEEAYKKDESAYIDWMEPSWYHEIYQNVELRKETEKYFMDF